MLANKRDLPGALDAGAVADALSLASVLSHHCRVVATSARTGENLLPALDWLVTDIAARLFTAD